ncbi:MAG: phage portal protein [Bauldia sp.]
MSLWSRLANAATAFRKLGPSVKISGRDDADTQKLARLASGSAAGKVVTVDTALTLSTAWSCMRLLSETIGTLPFPVYVLDAEGNREVARDEPLYTLLHDSPNDRQTAAEFIEGQVACLCGWGNAYAEKNYLGARLVALEPIHPATVSIRVDDTGRRFYRFAERGKSRELPEERIFHIRGFGFGGDKGLSPIAYARQTMGTALAADEVAALTFANGLSLSGFVKEAAGTKTSPEQLTALMDLFDRFLGSAKVGKVMPLPTGFEFQALSMNPEDAQLLETRAFHVEEICRWFRVPPFMVGHTEKSTSWGTGIEQQMIGFLTFSLRPYLTRIEQAVKKQLIPAKDRGRIFAEFNLDGLLRADSEGRSAMYASLGQNGYMTRNEGRRRENLKPMPGGDVLTVQSNLVPLDQLGKTPPRPTQPAAGEPL